MFVRRHSPHRMGRRRVAVARTDERACRSPAQLALSTPLAAMGVLDWRIQPGKELLMERTRYVSEFTSELSSELAGSRKRSEISLCLLSRLSDPSPHRSNEPRIAGNEKCFHDTFRWSGHQGHAHLHLEH